MRLAVLNNNINYYTISPWRWKTSNKSDGDESSMEDRRVHNEECHLRLGS